MNHITQSLKQFYMIDKITIDYTLCLRCNLAFHIRLLAFDIISNLLQAFQYFSYLINAHQIVKSNKTLATAISTHTKFTVILSAMMIFALGLDFSAYSFSSRLSKH